MINIVKGYKSKDYHNVNAVTTWEKLKNKSDPVSAPSMIKLDKQFRDSSLNKGQDHEVWKTDVENSHFRIDDMVSSISENQFMIHVLNNLPTEYDLQLALDKNKQ
jgi:hypothetical protein